VRFKVFMVMKIHVVFWAVTLHSVAVGYQHFRGPCCLHFQGEVNGDGKVAQSIMGAESGHW
jgi:hypothetical protein